MLEFSWSHYGWVVLFTEFTEVKEELVIGSISHTFSFLRILQLIDLSINRVCIEFSLCFLGKEDKEEKL